jgi:hypothetical protein
MPQSSKPGKKSLYSLHPSYAMEAAIIGNLPEKTGKTIDEWIKIIKKSGPAEAKDRRAWLKDKHGLTTNYAWMVVEWTEGNGGPDSYHPEALVEAMFAGVKAGLRPIYDELLRLGVKLGKDVKVCPCKTIVPFYRQHVFAEVKPANRTRIDLGFALGERKATDRLIDTGGYAKKDRITHRIGLTSVQDIDDEVKRWLKTAYDLDG